MKDYFENYLTSFLRRMEDVEVTDAEGNGISGGGSLDLLAEMTSKTKESGSKFFFAGNGASAAFASHMALDWSKNGGVPSFSLNDSVQLTALGNDLGFEEVFATPLQWHGTENDILVTISSSGNSPNILRAIEAARELRMGVVTFSGLKPDNCSRKMGDYNFYVPGKTYGIVECAHQLLLHAWLDQFMGVEEWSRESTQNMRADEFNL